VLCKTRNHLNTFWLHHHARISTYKRVEWKQYTMTLEPITGKVLRIFPQDTTGEEYSFSPIPKFMQELLDSGGLLRYLKEKGGYE